MKDLPSEEEELTQIYTKILKDVGEQIRNIRKSKGLNQVDLSACIDADKAFISNIENGHTNVTIKTLVRITVSLDVNLIILLEQTPKL